MTEQQILQAFRKALKVGDRVRHIADWGAGTVTRKTLAQFETSVVFDDRLREECPVNLKNLYPEWWPTPAWAKRESA